MPQLSWCHRRHFGYRCPTPTTVTAILASATLAAFCCCPPATTNAMAATDVWPSSSDQQQGGNGGAKEPRTFNLRDMDHPDAVAAQQLGLIQLYPPLSASRPAAPNDDNAKQYFRLLELDGNHLLIGAADSVHNISLQTFERVSIYRWAPAEAEHKECTMKSMDQELCRNFVRVLSRLSGGRLLICGTNAFAPRCRVLSPQGDTLSEFGAVGLAPFDPAQNSTYLLSTHGDEDMLYSATVADFAGTDALVFRRNVSEPVEGADHALLRTQRGNPLMLDRPQFVGTLQTEQYVYFFFHEEAAEAAAEFRPGSYSRVARVCKSDRGVPRRVATAEWSTFVKARLNCSVPERSRPFYFDELVAISAAGGAGAGGGGAAGAEDALIYATFVSEFNFLRHSVICAFRLRQVDELFRRGNFLAYDAAQRKWTRRERDELTAGLGQCPKPGQKPMGDEEAIAVRKYTLMADALPNAFPGGAVGIHRGADHYSQIAVLPDVPHMDGGLVDVLFVATDHGNVLKMVNLLGATTALNVSMPSAVDQRRRAAGANGAAGSNAGAGGAADDPLRLITVLRLCRQPIRRLLISGASPQRFLVVVTDQRVHRVQLQLCSLYSTCTQCVAARDPHCAWHHARCRHWQQIKSIDGEQPVQDVLGRKTVEELCRGKDNAATSVQQPPPAAGSKPNVANAVAAVVTSAEAPGNRTTKGKKACECGTGTADHRCACPAAEFVGGGVGGGTSPEGRQRSPPADQWPPTSSSSTEMDAIADAQALPWWVLLLLAVAVLQTVAFVWLCCRLHQRRRRRRRRNAAAASGSSGGKMALPPTGAEGHCAGGGGGPPISAYSAASILISNGATRRASTIGAATQPSLGDQYQQHHHHHNANTKNSSTTTSGQWTLSDSAPSAAGSVLSSNRSSAASSPVDGGGGAFVTGMGMCLGAPRGGRTVLARRASYTGGYMDGGGTGCGGEISIRLDGTSACGGTAMTLPHQTPAAPLPQHFAHLYNHHLPQQRVLHNNNNNNQWPPAMSTFRR